MTTTPDRPGGLSAWLRQQPTATLRTWLDRGREDHSATVLVMAHDQAPHSIPLSTIEAELVARARCD